MDDLETLHLSKEEYDIVLYKTKFVSRLMACMEKEGLDLECNDYENGRGKRAKRTKKLDLDCWKENGIRMGGKGKGKECRKRLISIRGKEGKTNKPLKN